MSIWTWVLIGLCALGVLLPIVPAIQVVLLLRRVRSRAANLRQARLFASLELLRLQQARLATLAGKAAPLAQRAKSAAETIRSSPSSAGYPEMRDALGSAGVEISELLSTLR